MTLRSALTLALVLLLGVPVRAQRVIPLYAGAASGSESWTQKEREYFSPAWRTQIVTNVVRPSLTAYLPAKKHATGTAVVICPGGGFYALSINSEGIQVAKWLAARGVAAFVLKYRLVRTGDDAVAEFSEAMKKPEAFKATIADVVPLAAADGRAAIAYVRAHATEFGVSPDRVGLMGFSAGGTVAVAVAFQYSPESRPSFVAPIYAYTVAVTDTVVPSDAPPLFVAAATDDDLDLAPQSVALYSKWIAAKKAAELHMYSRGGHGFGMRTQHLPADRWIERFGDWLAVQGLLKR